ncbi:lysophospholipid acyltransferase family protein [Oceanobacillus neutriphilus]|uniref:1-acyl-sn-glycerol-3-phosphate acyltransferase n=1 Tax=Oceanobacillus neutriphilus TaxID=531815 RepID=A0ABQ2NTX4_9BACI|nr:lysophospholipid acyltransferase family protein [Oceanobacillus neutriphilus]GGP10449.1 1-acyl-sn-glycerol-3-phosphate acyltransferase [Oceanobacillus neutriphilus]
MLYNFAKFIFTILFYPMYRMKVTGKHHIPKEGPVIICTNHTSNLDPPVVGTTASRTVHFMAKEELFKGKFLGGLLRRVHAFPVKRGLADRNALRGGLKILEEGETLGLFPEGTRSKDGKPGKPLPGVGFFALRSQAEVIPCVIISEYKLFRRTKVIYGKPMDAESFRKNKASAKEMSEGIMEEIRNLYEIHKN